MKTVILGMATSRPGEAPLTPKDGAGKRLCELAVEYGGLTREEYLEAFDFQNLLPYPWCRISAREAGKAASDRLGGRRVLAWGGRYGSPSGFLGASHGSLLEGAKS